MLCAKSCVAWSVAKRKMLDRTLSSPLDRALQMTTAMTDQNIKWKEGAG